MKVCWLTAEKGQHKAWKNSVAGRESPLPASAQKPKPNTPAIEQEQQRIADSLMRLLTSYVMTQWQSTKITRYYKVSEPECIGKLVILDRLGVIALLPGNRITLRIAPNLKWCANGPIQPFFQASVEWAFCNSDVASDDEQWIVLNGTLSASANGQCQQRMARLADTFNELSKAGLSLPLNDRCRTTAVIAVRQWHFAMFDQRKR